MRVRFLLIALLLFAGAAPARAVAPRRWSAARPIIDPAALRELDGGSFGIGRMLLPERSANMPLTDSELFALPSMAPVRKALDGEFDRYIADTKPSLPNETIGVGDGFDFQLFDRAHALFPRYALRAGGHRQPDGPRLCLARRTAARSG